VTKKEIVKQISDTLNLPQTQVKDMVQMTFDAIINTLVESEDHRIELRNFGVFEVKVRKARKARNPRTNERVDVPPRVVVVFKPGKEMEERVAQIPIETLMQQTRRAAQPRTAMAGVAEEMAGATTAASAETSVGQ